eukprot:CAMPEP_0177396652 /NCGR_PEP_ID=MMETSP0368-20130122/56858_1 /TAXON_ID=447022 ORGANISM="Scrippsiella hangoei-like, Strain SHHI-4" /NCGR_SAMPLE_ID=MMETSP0368 /ASSEMBLY_ACC=CAM_ASM_000363 /LENGTH=489 /DNA_ID=CAMNT_0018863435 /DNA_START=293 /DNA_END=1759 /DNA_ORIENTATION=+
MPMLAGGSLVVSRGPRVSLLPNELSEYFKKHANRQADRVEQTGDTDGGAEPNENGRPSAPSRHVGVVGDERQSCVPTDGAQYRNMSEDALRPMQLAADVWPRGLLHIQHLASLQVALDQPHTQREVNARHDRCAKGHEEDAEAVVQQFVDRQKLLACRLLEGPLEAGARSEGLDQPPPPPARAPVPHPALAPAPAEVAAAATVPVPAVAAAAEGPAVEQVVEPSDRPKVEMEDQHEYSEDCCQHVTKPPRGHAPHSPPAGADAVLVIVIARIRREPLLDPPADPRDYHLQQEPQQWPNDEWSDHELFEQVLALLEFQVLGDAHEGPGATIRPDLQVTTRCPQAHLVIIEALRHHHDDHADDFLVQLPLLNFVMSSDLDQQARKHQGNDAEDHLEGQCERDPSPQTPLALSPPAAPLLYLFLDALTPRVGQVDVHVHELNKHVDRATYEQKHDEIRGNDFPKDIRASPPHLTEENRPARAGTATPSFFLK